MASPFSSVEAKAKADQSRSEKSEGWRPGGPMETSAGLTVSVHRDE